MEELQKGDPKLKVWPNTLSRKLKAKQKDLEASFGVVFVKHRTEDARYIELEPMADLYDMYNN